MTEQKELFSLQKIRSSDGDCVYDAFSYALYDVTGKETVPADYLSYLTLRGMCGNQHGGTAGEIVVPIINTLASRYDLTIGVSYRIYTPDDYLEMAEERGDFCLSFVTEATKNVIWREMETRFPYNDTWAIFCYLKTEHAEYGYIPKRSNNVALAIHLFKD